MSDYEPVIFSGGPVKSLPGNGPGAFGGMGIIFGSANETDLTSDYFSPRTQLSLQPGDTIRTFYRHGTDPLAGKKELTRSAFKKQRAGVWFEGRLDLSDPVQQRVNNLIAKGKLGFSTGSLSHLVVKERRETSNEIVVWPVGELSFSPAPCEYRTRVVSLKSLMDGTAALSETDLERWEQEQEMIADQYLRMVEGLSNKNLTAEMRSREIYLELLRWQHEMQMRELEAPQYGDARSYYSALAELAMCEHKERMEKIRRS